MRKNKKAFTLIELIAVLVILAIIALIVTPLVMNIVKKAKDSANKRSVDAYGKAVELGVATYLLDNGDYPTDISNLTIEYSGNEVVCNIQKLNEDGSIYLSECSVNGTEVKDSSTDDGYYHYVKTTDTQSEPIVYQAYNIGDMVTYNGMNFYVIAPSDESKDSVTLLKEEPLTVDEVNTYGGVGTNDNHVNRYTRYNSGTAYDYDGYGDMAYYTSETCGYIGDSWVETGCTTDYDTSDVKYVVDAWSDDKLNIKDLSEDSLGYTVRLITFDELLNDLGFIKNESQFIGKHLKPSEEDTPLWSYDGNYNYWTMSGVEDSISSVWRVNFRGGAGLGVFSTSENQYRAVVRPVINLLKSAI